MCKDVVIIIALFAEKINPYYGAQIKEMAVWRVICLEQMASLRSARQAYAPRTKFTKLYSEKKRETLLPKVSLST